MNTKTEKALIGMIREEYRKRLVEVLAESVMTETDVIDKRGNMLLSPGLKVRHVDSGYEYTVDGVEGKGDNVEIHLRKPEIPRFDPPDSQTELMELDVTKIDYGRATGGQPSGTIVTPAKKPHPHEMSVPESSHDEEILVVTKSEFEKEYEVD